MTQDIYARATAVFRQLAAEGHRVTHPERIDFGPGACHGPACMASYDALEDPRAFYRAAAERLDAPRPAAIAAVMVHLRAWRPDEDAIARDRDALVEAAGQIAPALNAIDNARWLFWKDAAWVAAQHGAPGASSEAVWVAVRCMLAAIAGVTPNPFAAYLLVREG